MLSKSLRFLAIASVIFGATVVFAKTKTNQNQQELREAYLSRVQQQTAAQMESRSLGSLWTPGASLDQLSADFKARTLNDTIVIVVAELTSAQSSGNVTSQRDFQTQAGITGLLAHLSTRGVNPLLAANSSTQLKGQGQTSAASRLQTSLTGQVIAVLPNGNLVVEAERQLSINNQRETMIVRGVVRPGDVAANNSVLSSMMGNLEIEMKGKGIISDSTRPPNRLTRVILRLFGF